MEAMENVLQNPLTKDPSYCALKLIPAFAWKIYLPPDCS